MTDDARDLLLVLSTCPDLESGRRVAGALVAARLAACVNLVPGLTSIYRWQGAVQEEGEVLLLIKCRRSDFERLRAALVDAHPYEVPEVLAVPTAAVHPPYRDWALGETERDAAP